MAKKPKKAQIQESYPVDEKQSQDGQSVPGSEAISSFSSDEDEEFDPNEEQEEESDNEDEGDEEEQEDESEEPTIPQRKSAPLRTAPIQPQAQQPVVVQLHTGQKEKREKKTATAPSVKIDKVSQMKRQVYEAMGLSEIEAANFKFYIYREAPETWYDENTDQMLHIGGFLELTTNPPGPEYLERKFGSGTYRVRIYGPSDDKSKGVSHQKDHVFTISGNSPNLSHLPKESPMEQREQAAQQRQSRRFLPQQNQGSEINERMIDVSTGVLQKEVTRLRQRESELLHRMDLKDEAHKKELSSIQKQLQEIREASANRQQAMDPIHQRLIAKGLGEDNSVGRGSVAEMMQVAKMMQPDLSGINSSISSMVDSVKMQMESTTRSMQQGFEQSTRFLQQQMDQMNKSFDERMAMQQKQLEFYQEQAQKKVAPADPRSELRETLALLKDTLAFKKELTGDDEDGGGKDDRMDIDPSAMPWWASTIENVFGKALFQMGPAVSQMMGLPEGAIKEQIKQSGRLISSGETEPADMDDDELLEAAQQQQQAQQAQQQQEQELDPQEVKLMSLVSLMDEALILEKTAEATAEEIYPLLLSQIKAKPSLITADPNLIWSFMKSYIDPESKFASEEGRVFTVRAIAIVRKRYMEENQDEES